MNAFQASVDRWIQQCFGAEIAADKTERNHRFLEEALELVQAGGCTVSEAHQLVDYVYGRPVGDLEQEVGGVAVTLSALCSAHGVALSVCSQRELFRIGQKIEQIRAKQAAKPKHSPLPVSTAIAATPDRYEEGRAAGFKEAKERALRIAEDVFVDDDMAHCLRAMKMEDRNA